MQGLIDGAVSERYGYDARVEVLGTRGIVFVGEQEDFAEDWKRFFKKFYGKEVPLEEKNVLAKHREVLPGYREAIERIHPDEFLLYEEVLRRKAQLLEEESRSTEGRN
jgi:hypothetical protein